MHIPHVAIVSCCFFAGHDWSKFIEYVVTDLEGDTTEGAVERREIRMKQVIKEIIPCDASKSEFFEGEYQTRQYDIVQSSRCLESVCESREAYQRGIAQLSSYVKPGGYLQILTAVEAGYYSCSDAGNSHSLYAVPVGEEDVLKGFEIAGKVLFFNFLQLELEFLFPT